MAGDCDGSWPGASIRASATSERVAHCPGFPPGNAVLGCRETLETPRTPHKQQEDFSAPRSAHPTCRRNLTLAPIAGPGRARPACPGGRFDRRAGVGTPTQISETHVHWSRFGHHAIVQDRMVSLHGGRDHVAAPKSHGTVWTWGRNQYGQIGDGTGTNRPNPTLVTGLTDVIAVETGHYNTMALSPTEPSGCGAGTSRHRRRRHDDQRTRRQVRT